ncbi:MAG: tyrosine decarboxylase MfnA [Candidatus Jordarchaeales archaeon]|nr:tyrosine decarboxylase MfnA [Candidatus Jordarchaeia archaeon]
MKLRGISAKEVLRELEERLVSDMSYHSGRILGSMCTLPHPLARKIFSRYLEKNLGDPGLFPATFQLEREVISMLGELLGNSNASGIITSGGTEANISAMRIARNVSRKNGRKGKTIIVPESAHASFDKAADLLDVKIIKARLDEEYRVDVDDVQEKVTSDTFAIVGIAGTTALGTVDPIEALSDIAEDKGIYLHVDAAFGGFVLPFLEKAGFRVPSFDFRNEGVCSITVDPHKMGMAPIPAGGLLLRDEKLFIENSFEIPYLAGGKYNHPIILGTRSGATVIATWALLNHLGVEGYTKIVKRCMRNTRILERGIQKIDGLRLPVKPTMNIIGILSDIVDVCKLDLELRKKGWALGKFPEFLRIVVMPHVKKRHIIEFLSELESAVQILLASRTLTSSI